MNTLVHILAKSGLLTKDLDYHLIRASMVLIFLAFGYQKWFAYEAGPDSVYQQWPADFLALPRLRHPRGQLVSRRFRMALRRPPLPGILEQATGNLGRYWVDCHVCRDGYHHSVHAEWLGPSCWISRDGRQRSVPDEGCRPLGSVDLLVETGCPACPRSRR